MTCVRKCKCRLAPNAHLTCLLQKPFVSTSKQNISLFFSIHYVVLTHNQSADNLIH